MNSKKPGISIILPVYNCEKFIEASIRSILTQTYSDFELIIIDDGSTDNSRKIIEKIMDNRIKYYWQNNQGLSRSINRGIKISKYEYIARQDADDISLPKRLEKQIMYMNSNPRCGLLGTWARVINETNLTNRYLIHPVKNHECKYKLLFDCCFTHSSVVMRKSIIRKVGFFNETVNQVPPEDYEYWSRVSKVSDIGNIPEVLVHFREHSSSMSYEKPYKLRSNASKISINNILYYSDRNTYQIARSIAILNFNLKNDKSYTPKFKEIRKLLIKILRRIESNENKNYSMRREINLYIIKLRIKWLMNYTFIFGLYKYIKPSLEKLLSNYYVNLIKKIIKALF
tara:strand:+ start:638 stop:1663 length:1026 start_codon:yes stop_codon:yes gene_type:complete